MQCREASLWIGAWLDGEAAPGVPEHVAACPACSREAEELRLLKREIALRHRSAAPAALRASIARALRPRPLPFRWFGAAAAAAVVVAAVMLAAPPESSGVPDIVTRSSAFYDEIFSGGIEPQPCSTPAELRKYFREKLGVAVDAPEIPGAAISGGCPCDVRAKASPWIVYRKGTDVLSLLVFDGALPTLPRSARRTTGAAEYYAFVCGQNTVILCPTGPTGHLWIARMPEDEMVATILATPEGRRALEGVRITVREVT